MLFKRLKEFFGNISADCLAACVYFLCLPFTIVTTPFGSLLKLVTMPVTAILIIKLLLGKRKPLRFNGVHFIYTLYIVWVLCGLFFLIDEYSTVQTRDMLLTFAVMLLISVRVYNACERELIENSWLAVGLICIYLGLTSTHTIGGDESRMIINIFGNIEDPNQFCAYFIMPAMLCIKRISEKRKLTPLYIAVIILILYSVLKTGSRGGLVGIVIGIVFCVLIGIKSFKAKIGVLLIGALCAVLVVTVLFPLLPETLQSRYSVSRVIEDRGAGRFDIWKYLVEYTAENPSRLIRGSGLFSTYSILEKAHVVDSAGAAHNQFVQVLTDQGLIGLILFTALICVCIFRNIKRDPCSMCAFISVMAFSMSLTLYVFKPYINIIIMCALNYEGAYLANSYRKGAEKNVNR